MGDHDVTGGIGPQTGDPAGRTFDGELVAILSIAGEAQDCPDPRRGRLRLQHVA